MAKILTGSAISYGTSLPAGSTVSDGTLFFLTAGYTDPANSPSNPTAAPVNRVPGLLLFNFQQDSNPSIVGDQVGQIWKQLTTLQIGVDSTGDTMSGPLAIVLGTNAPQLHLTSQAPGIRFTETDQASNSRDWHVVVDGGALQIQTRTDAFGLLSTVFSINRSGVATISGGTVWHSNNDGSGSNLDADLLDGQQGSFYLNSANHSGVVPISRGGTGATSTNSGGIVYGAGSSLATSATGAPGQILASGGGGAPTWVNASSIGSGSSATANALSPGATIALSGAATGTATLFTGASGISIPVTALNASNLSAGTVPIARLGSSGTANSTTFLRGDNTWAVPPVGSPGGGGTVESVTINTSGNGISGSGTITTTGTITISSSGTDANVPSTLVFRNVSGNFSAGTITATFSGNGSAITNLNAAAIATNTVPTARLGSGTANGTTFLRGDGTWATPPTGSGGVSSIEITTSGGITGGGTLTSAGSLNISSNATAANTGSTIVLRDGSGNFNAGTITATFSGNGSAITNLNAAAIATNQVPVARLGTGTANSTTFLRGDGTWDVPPAGGGGSLTSVSLSIPSSVFNITNATVTGTGGTLTAVFQTQNANTVFAGPTSGGAAIPAFRAIVAADIPTLNQNTTGTAANVTGTVAIANGGTGATTAAAARTALGAGTVTSVGISGGTTGLTATAAITTSGTITLGGTLAIANGGTGSTTAAAARTALGAGTGDGTVTNVTVTAQNNGATLSVANSTTTPALTIGLGNITPASVSTTGTIVTTNTTASTSTSTGALRSSGGLGVAGAIWCASLNSTGDVTAFASSDIRLKSNIEIIPNALNKLMSLSGVTYNWNKTAVDAYGKTMTTREAGVIAQEVAEALPEVVTTRDDGFMAVRYERMVPLLIEAMKEQQHLINALIREVEELKAR